LPEVDAILVVIANRPCGGKRSVVDLHIERTSVVVAGIL
jgi:hypothetical protein